MFISHLSINNFRNYGRLELDLGKGSTLLHGENAQGKTNLLEAIYYIGTTRSPYTNQDNQLLNWEAHNTGEPIIVGRLTVNLVSPDATSLVEMRLVREHKQNGQITFRREALVNKRKVRLMDILGQLKVVLFIPEDVNLITGPPNNRRRYLNITLCQVDRDYCRTLSQYNKVLEQRNAALKQIQEGFSSLEVLDIFTEQLISLGSKIIARRAVFFAEISRDTQRIHYEELTGGRETLRLAYLPRLHTGRNDNNLNDEDDLAQQVNENAGEYHTISGILAEALVSSQAADIARGATNVGPHRDDWRFWINNRDLSNYGSRGQQRSAILALKLAEINWMTLQTGETPILLLDEVVAELDEHRRALLLQAVGSVEQSILTATDPAMFTADFLSRATILQVAAGQVYPDKNLDDPASQQVQL